MASFSRPAALMPWRCCTLGGGGEGIAAEFRVQGLLSYGALEWSPKLYNRDADVVAELCPQAVNECPSRELEMCEHLIGILGFRV